MLEAGPWPFWEKGMVLRSRGEFDTGSILALCCHEPLRPRRGAGDIFVFRDGVRLGVRTIICCNAIDSLCKS